MAGIANAVNGPEAAPYIAKAGGTMTGALILNTNSPTTSLEAASKGYVDAVAQGLNILAAAYAGTTGNLNAIYDNGTAGVGATLTNNGALAAFSTDGVSPPLNSRILVKNQTSAVQNGVYTLTTVGSGAVAWVLTRATDYDEPSEINPGDFIIINFGSTLTHSSWIETATVTNIGADNIDWSQFGATFPLPLSLGGTGAALTASNGGIFYSTGAAGAILAGTATARQMLQSGASAAPSWSTATWPATTTANRVLYSSATNVVGEITGANSSILTTNSTGVPSMQSMAWTDFTPTVTLVGGAGNTVPVYTNNNGRYCRIGNTVYLDVELQGDGGAEGAGTGRLTIALPVNVAATSVGTISSFIDGIGWAINGTTHYQLAGLMAANASTIGLEKWTTISAASSFLGDDQNNTTRAIRLKFFYEVAAL